MLRRAIFWLLLTLAIGMTACARPSATPAPADPPQSDRPAPVSPGQPPNKPGWRYITTTDSDMWRLVSTAPDGGSFLMTSALVGDRSSDLLVTVGDGIKITRPPFRRVTFATPDHWQADIVQLPWGTIVLEVGSSRANESGGVISPDLRYAAIPLYDGLWLGDVQTGSGRIITLPMRTDRPPDMGPRDRFIWAAQPHWSPDSRWIYFQSNRQKPYVLTWWRIAVSGGVEEPVAGEVLGDAQPTGSELRIWQSTAQRIQTDGFFFRELSPDGRWAAADKTDTATFRLYNLEHPDASITYTGPPDYLAGTGYNGWSPDSSKIIFHQSPISKVAPEMGVLALGADGATASLYAFPDANAGKVTARGFVGSDHLLVAVQPWAANHIDAQPQTQWWLADLKAVAPTGRPPVP